MKKNIALLLLLSLLSGMAASCAKTEQETNDQSDSTAPPETIETEIETARISTDLPDSNFEGYTFHIIYDKILRHPEVDVSELTGETINDAVYQRNANVEELYNITIEGIEDPNSVASISAAVNAGDNAYDLTLLSSTTAAGLVTDDMMIDINTIPYIDLTKPWYDQYANDALSIGGMNHLIVGDLNIRDNDATYLLMYSQELASNMGITNLYDMAVEGSWTMDRFIEIIERCAVDLNGDGEQNEHDQWGVTGEAWLSNVYIGGAGEYLVVKDNQDIPYINMGGERYFDAFYKSYQINANKNYSFIVEDFSALGDAVWDVRTNIFMEDRSLFATTIVGGLYHYRDMEKDFGIVPIPKYEESQEYYHSFLTYGQVSAIAVPKSIKNFDRTGIIVEALSAEGLYVLTPAYYDNCITTKYARSENFSQILDLVTFIENFIAVRVF